MYGGLEKARRRRATRLRASVRCSALRSRGSSVLHFLHPVSQMPSMCKASIASFSRPSSSPYSSVPSGLAATSISSKVSLATGTIEGMLSSV